MLFVFESRLKFEFSSSSTRFKPALSLGRMLVCSSKTCKSGIWFGATLYAFKLLFGFAVLEFEPPLFAPLFEPPLEFPLFPPPFPFPLEFPLFVPPEFEPLLPPLVSVLLSISAPV